MLSINYANTYLKTVSMTSAPSDNYNTVWFFCVLLPLSLLYSGLGFWFLVPVIASVEIVLDFLWLLLCFNIVQNHADFNLTCGGNYLCDAQWWTEMTMLFFNVKPCSHKYISRLYIKHPLNVFIPYLYVVVRFLF